MLLWPVIDSATEIAHPVPMTGLPGACVQVAFQISKLQMAPGTDALARISSYKKNIIQLHIFLQFLSVQFIEVDQN